MAQLRETVTDQLFNVIQVIQLGRKSGLLTVERGDDLAFEEGTIHFVNGQVTQANAGQRHGIEAFDWLSTWGYCRFSFISSTTEGVSIAPPATSIPHSSPANTLVNTFPKPLQQITATNTRVDPFTKEYPYRMRARQTDTEPSMALVPKRTAQADEALHLIEQMDISHAHRRLLLLVNGYRGITELARLMGRKQDDVYILLGDLVRAGLIHF